ncbi:MAG TPA: zf-HC2 domain-containing protein [Gemmataceae bacterium]|nr:zf-HC2 domain-containing protein [Gemmataceae bacterium]
MQCSDARPLLPLHVYGDVAASERAALEEHLAECPACRQELAAFRTLREQLSAVPVPSPVVDVGRILHVQMVRQQRRTRRWQLVALAAVAATVLVLLTRLEVEANGRQFVIRWGKPEPAPVVVELPVVTPTPAPVSSEPSREMLERLQVMNDLIHALADTVETGDRQRREDLLRLQMELANLRLRTQQQYLETQHDVDALYIARFGSPVEGEKP